MWLPSQALCFGCFPFLLFLLLLSFFFFFNDTATTEIYTLSLHDALPIYQLLNLDFQSMPVYDVQDYIGNLDLERQKLLQTADSLSSVADTYKRKAEQLRKSIQAPPE